MAMSSSNADYPHIKGLDLDPGADLMWSILFRRMQIMTDLGAGDDFTTTQDPERYSSLLDRS